MCTAYVLNPPHAALTAPDRCERGRRSQAARAAPAVAGRAAPTLIAAAAARGASVDASSGLAEEGEEDDADDEEWFEDEVTDCTLHIAPGTPVREAEIEDGVFVALQLLL